MRVFAALALSTAVCFGAAGAALAQEYPSKPIRIIVPFAAGAQSDGLARLMGGELAKRLGQPVVIENKPGATGMIGTELLAKSPADGYTLAIGTNSTHAANKYFFKTIPYDVENDFVPIAMIGTAPYVLLVNPSLPVNSVPDLVKYAKAKPGQVAFPYANSVNRISGATFGVLTGTKLVEVPYKANGQALIELIDGQTQMMFADIGTGLPFVTAGRLKAIAVMPERSAKLPGVPAIKEVLPSFQVDNWTGFFVPAKTPPEIVERLNREINAILASPGMPGEIDALGYDLLKPMSPAQWSKYIAGQVVQYRELTRNAGIVPE